jgi:uncharacterized protein with PQ loop repeat
VDDTNRNVGMNVDATVSFLAVVATVSFAWPQVFRALRHGVAGVSVAAITQSLISASAWFGYGLAQRQPAVMMADIGVISGQLVVTVLLVRNQALRAPLAIAAVVAAAALIGLSQVPTLTTAIVAVAGIVALTSALSQLLEVVREPEALEGLSAGTYAILTAMAVIWLAYGWLRADPVIIVPNLAMIPMASYVAWTASRSHHEPHGAATVDPDLSAVAPEQAR